MAAHRRSSGFCRRFVDGSLNRQVERQAASEPEPCSLGRSSQGRSPVRWALGLLLVLALAPAPARAASFSFPTLDEIIRGTAWGGMFGQILDLGGGVLTNALLYSVQQQEYYTGLAVTDLVNLTRNTISPEIDDINSYLSNISSTSLSQKGLLVNVSNLLNSIDVYLHNNLGTILGVARNTLSQLGNLDSLSSSGHVGRTLSDSLSKLGGVYSRLGADSHLGITASNILSAINGIPSYLSSKSHIGSSLTNIFNRLGGVVDGLSALDGIGSKLSSVYSRLGADSHLGITASNILSAINGIPSYLSSKSHIGSSLTNIFNRLGGVVDGLSALDGIGSKLSSVYSRLGADSHLGVTASNILAAVNSLAPLLKSDSHIGANISNIANSLSSGFSGVIDGLDSGTTSIIDRLAQLPGYITSGVSSIVGALGDVAITFPDSITATLAPGVTIPAETDVAGEAAQSATLWDTIVGDVDTSAIESQFNATVGVLRTSFPFGLFFCVSDFFSSLVASPVAPVFETDLPTSFNSSTHVVLDLSFFDSVAALLRGGFVVLYSIGLFSVTKSWVYNGGGDSA